MSESDAPAADWYPDPSGRFQFRYWDGETWTGHVSTEGKTDWDPPGESAPEQAAESAAADPQTAEAAPAADLGTAEAEQAESQWAPESASAEAPAASEADSDAGAAPAGEHLEAEEPSDTNLVANRRAGIAGDVQAWLDEVAHQVEPRLSRISREWTAQPQADAARACAYGLLMGHLAHLHPHMRSELGQVAEAHPSFTTLEAGARLETLEQIASDPARAAAWLGPLIGVSESDRVTMLFD